ncbi:hypothetical protein F4861DRAFT_424884 [Xylaria intraflava]|nr:hypothetical protein F4861DRAFT_424884 [Xylaria intraflava]
MPFPYRYICDLLQQLDDEVQKAPEKQTAPDTIINSWFGHHRSLINAPGTNVCAVLSALLPEKRTDRVYSIQAPRLQGIFGKALRLGTSRVSELRRWSKPGSGIDLGDCVEDILRRTPNSRDDTTHLFVEEIDDVLAHIAAACKFSSPAARAVPKKFENCDSNTLLGGIYTRLGSRDAKWFTRLILKNYQPVILKRYAVFRSYHPLLPRMMEIRDDLPDAIAGVRHVDEKADEPGTIASILKPSLGTKVGRQPWFKGRSIKNCMDMVHGRDIACEQKMDGEYCQIHIDLSKAQDCIQIFSKSGKDSTKDRIHLHKAIHDSLKIGTKDCPFTRGCILEGELVVYSTKECKILPFHKIRKHVSRSGVFLGTKKDSQAHEHEHLMIIYYDVLLIDNESLLGIKNSERFRRLSNIVTSRKGYAELVSRTTICTSQSSAVPALRELFAQCISSRDEGLVLKPDEPYIDFSSEQRPYGCCNIKLKKEYIQGWGDVGDFAVIGASYDAAKAKEYQLPNVRWTHFFIGCLENNDRARAKTETPLFRVTNVVELTGPVLSAFWAQGSPISEPYEENTSIQLNLSGSMLAKKPTVVFPCPLVFDMRCFSFDKEPNTNFWSMRFPQVSKVHHDRLYLDTISFSELQEIAEGEKNFSAEDSQEMRRWVKSLEGMDGEGSAVDASSQDTTCSEAPISPSSSASSQFIERRSGYDLSTPLRSSAIEPVAASKEAKQAGPASTSNSTKRPFTEDSDLARSPKRCRRHSNVSSMNSSQNTVTAPDTNPAHTRRREPLSQVDPNIPPKTPPRPTSGHPQHILPPLKSPVRGEGDICHQGLLSSPAAAYYTASEMGSSPPPPPPPPSGTAMARRDSIRTASRTTTDEANACCSIAGHECALANCSVLLSPCISGYAWITDDLLGRHGILNPVLDLRAWDTKPPLTCKDAGSAKDVSTPQATPGSNQQTRKICLVESKRKEATEAFLRRIKDADIRKKDGRQERITAYDWRVLESITEHESKAKSSRGGDPWRRFYVGVV